VNDYLLKYLYHNWLTGKLSDVVGLLACSMLIWYGNSKYKMSYLVFLASGFALWKVEASNSLIDAANDLGIPIGRVVDYTDLLVIPVIFLPIFTDWLLRIQNVRLVLRPTVLIVISVSFVATTMPPRQLQEYNSVDKSYSIRVPLSTVVARLNEYQVDELKDIELFVDFNSNNNTYHARYTGEKVAQLIDYRKVGYQDTFQIGYHFADVQLSGNEYESTIKIVNLYKMVGVGNEKDYQRKLIRAFEKSIVKRLYKEEKRIKEFEELTKG